MCRNVTSKILIKMMLKILHRNLYFICSKMTPLRLLVLTVLVLTYLCSTKLVSADRNMTLGKRHFAIDWDHNTFVKDGQPFRFIAGSFHYFRAHPDSWQRKLRTMRAAGLNAVTTYVEWSLHNPKEGIYVWEGIADVERFIRLAVEEDLLVILRPGPYICAERDMGGFPYWLLTKYPNIQLRTADINYLFEVRVWYSQLMERMKPFLYGNGGPIIMVQVENEYGSYYACDKKYREWIRDETQSHVKNKAVLFTNDGPSQLPCGFIPGVLATLDFGATSDLKSMWNKLRAVQPKGPLVNVEYYPGWLTHWSESMANVKTSSVTPTFINMLDDGASVNFYMFFGGTNFGYTAGANDGGDGGFQPDITSYDYNAPMTEAGDTTDKYFKLREIIANYLPLPNITVPSNQPKKHYGTINLKTSYSLLSKEGINTLSTGTLSNKKPLTFEALNQYSGLVLYETELPQTKRDPSVLKVESIRDRGYVYVDGILAGILSREHLAFQLPISALADRHIRILVENQGRLNYGPTSSDFKGLLGEVLLDNQKIKNWNMTRFPLESYDDIQRLIQHSELDSQLKTNDLGTKQLIMHNGPTVFHGELIIEDKPCDTYLDPTGWGKGIVFVNGENLGRYWPAVGPQVTLYVPQEVLKKGINAIVLVEYQRAPNDAKITFSDTPNLNGMKIKKQWGDIDHY